MTGGGSLWDLAGRDHSYGWSIAYSHDLDEHLFASLVYLNEGHVPGHHRDGHAAQLWMRGALAFPQLIVAAGIGPYRFFDTEVAEGSSQVPFRNAHGWAALYSVAATWREPGSSVSYRLRVDHIETQGGAPDTTLAMVGVAMRLDQDPTFGRGRAHRRDEIVALAGRTIVNSYESESAWARSIEYRHAFGSTLRGSVGWIDEGDARLVRRNGVVLEAWLEPTFHEDRYTIGMGAGTYVAVDDYRGTGNKHRALGIISVTTSYHFAQGWVARLIWHRISSNYDRDSDIILLGVGYRG